MKFILSIAMTFVLCATVASSCNAQTTDTTVTVKVKGIGCATDLKMIEANVDKLEGISKFKVRKQGATTTIDIQFDPQLVTVKEIYAAIEGTGGCDDPDDRPYKVKK